MYKMHNDPTRLRLVVVVVVVVDNGVLRRRLLGYEIDVIKNGVHYLASCPHKHRPHWTELGVK